ncbi:MAG: glycosyltransferase [Spirochaetales bacterium]|nr:glycosyltransferase [Spirochaetales bacterium]
MKILYFAPIATKKNLSFCPFITQRVIELQKQGIEVDVLLHGNLQIGKYGVGVNRKGIRKLFDVIRNILLRFGIVRLLFQHKRCCNHPLGSFSYYTELRFLNDIEFIKWYNRHNFDLIHIHFLGCAGFVPELHKKYGIRYIITAHGSDIHAEVPLGNQYEIERALNILNNADKSIFVSKFLLNYAKSFGYNGKNAIVIHNGVNTSVFFPMKSDIKKNSHYIGFVGHPIYVKRAEILPDVLFLVKKVFSDTRMLILGSEENDLIPLIKDRAEQLGVYDAIDLVAAVSPEKVGDYMRQLDVLLLPSRNEGFGCVAIEAQVCGVGVVGSANGGIPEAIGKNGIIVSESDNFTQDFANAVIDYLKNPLSQQVILQNIGDCSWRECVLQEIQIYNNIASIFSPIACTFDA